MRHDSHKVVAWLMIHMLPLKDVKNCKWNYQKLQEHCWNLKENFRKTKQRWVKKRENLTEVTKRIKIIQKCVLARQSKKLKDLTAIKKPNPINKALKHTIESQMLSHQDEIRTFISEDIEQNLLDMICRDKLYTTLEKCVLAISILGNQRKASLTGHLVKLRLLAISQIFYSARIQKWRLI